MISGMARAKDRYTGQQGGRMNLTIPTFDHKI
jgi:hypothetical protein